MSKQPQSRTAKCFTTGTRRSRAIKLNALDLGHKETPKQLGLGKYKPKTIIAAEHEVKAVPNADTRVEAAELETAPSPHAWQLTRRDVDQVLHHTHWIPVSRGFTKQFLAEYYPGFSLKSLIGLFDTAGVRILPQDLDGAPGAPHGGRCHWQMVALNFSSPDEFEVIWDRTLPRDNHYTINAAYEELCKTLGRPLAEYDGPAGEGRRAGRVIEAVRQAHVVDLSGREFFDESDLAGQDATPAAGSEASEEGKVQ